MKSFLSCCRKFFTTFLLFFGFRCWIIPEGWMMLNVVEGLTTKTFSFLHKIWFLSASQQSTRWCRIFFMIIPPDFIHYNLIELCERVRKKVQFSKNGRNDEEFLLDVGWLDVGKNFVTWLKFNNFAVNFITSGSHLQNSSWLEYHFK